MSNVVFIRKERFKNNERSDSKRTKIPSCTKYIDLINTNKETSTLEGNTMTTAEQNCIKGYRFTSNR